MAKTNCEMLTKVRKIRKTKEDAKSDKKRIVGNKNEMYF